MIGKYKDFYRFVQCNNASICDLWEKYMTYPNPTKGDKYIFHYISLFLLLLILHEIYTKMLYRFYS